MSQIWVLTLVPAPITIGMLSFHSTKVELRASRKSKQLTPVEGGYIDRGVEGELDREVIYSMAILTGARVNPPTIIIDSLHNREICDLQPNDELEEVVINPHFPEQTVKVGLEIHSEERRILIEFLRANCDVFAWRVEDMQGMDFIRGRLCEQTNQWCGHTPDRTLRGEV